MANAKVEIEPIIRSFVESVIAIVEGQMVQRVQNAVASAFAASAAPKTISGAETGHAAKPATKKGRKLNLSPEAIAVRKRQAKYMSIIKPLTTTNRERVKKVAREKGVAAAIRFAGTL